MALTKDQIREKMMNFGKKIQDFEGTLPGLEALAGELAVKELSAADTTAISDIATLEKGYSNALDIGATIARALVTKDTKERIYSDTDAEAVSEFGLSILTPLINKVKEISGLSTTVADTKKNGVTPPQANQTASVTNSTATPVPPVVEDQSNSFSTTSPTENS